MRYYFLKGDDIGYLDMGLFQSKYTALIFARRVCKKASHGKTYYLHSANDKRLAKIRCTPTARYEWIKGENDD